MTTTEDKRRLNTIRFTPSPVVSRLEASAFSAAARPGGANRCSLASVVGPLLRPTGAAVIVGDYLVSGHLKTI